MTSRIVPKITIPLLHLPTSTQLSTLTSLTSFNLLEKPLDSVTKRSVQCTRLGFILEFKLHDESEGKIIIGEAEIDDRQDMERNDTNEPYLKVRAEI